MSKGRSVKTTTSRGKEGESIALRYLEGKGYTLVQANYRNGKAEIDLIVQKDTLLVFVEVKLRSSLHFGFPESFVILPKQKRIIFAAEEYILEKNWQGNIRFDIIAIVDMNGDVQIEHFEDCF